VSTLWVGDAHNYNNAQYCTFCTLTVILSTDCMIYKRCQCSCTIQQLILLHFIMKIMEKYIMQHKNMQIIYTQVCVKSTSYHPTWWWNRTKHVEQWLPQEMRQDKTMSDHFISHCQVVWNNGQFQHPAVPALTSCSYAAARFW